MFLKTGYSHFACKTDIYHNYKTEPWLSTERLLEGLRNANMYLMQPRGISRNWEPFSWDLCLQESMGESPGFDYHQPTNAAGLVSFTPTNPLHFLLL
jgi:hypothetical protein